MVLGQLNLRISLLSVGMSHQNGVGRRWIKIGKEIDWIFDVVFKHSKYDLDRLPAVQHTFPCQQNDPAVAGNVVDCVMNAANNSRKWVEKPMTSQTTNIQTQLSNNWTTIIKC